MGEQVVKKKTKMSWVVKTAVLATVFGLVICVLVDFSTMKNDYLEGYLETKVGVGQVISSKQNFLMRYQNTLEGSQSTVDEVIRLQGINISEELFTATAIRLNTEIYTVAANVLNEEFMEQYFGNVETEIVRTVKESMEPLMFVCLAAGEAGTWNNNEYTWVPAIYSRPLSGVTAMEEVRIQDVDSLFYWELGLGDYFRCDENTSGHPRDCNPNLHYSFEGSGIRNDADSLGPLQILRRNVTVNAEAKGKSVEEVLSGAKYHINVIDSGGLSMYSVTDLMRWEDNVVWAFNNFMDKVRGRQVSRVYQDWCVSGEYELMCMIAVAHNTGASYLRNADGSAGSSWKSQDAVYQFCKLVGSPEAIAYISMTYIEPWYEDVKTRIQEGKEWSMPGNSCFEGEGRRKDEIMRDILEYLGVVFTDGENYPLNCTYWNRTSRSGSDHKFRYPMKTLFNYLALQRLYSSGER